MVKIGLQREMGAWRLASSESLGDEALQSQNDPGLCDEERPQCRNCVRLGIECPGYASALQFINSTSASVPTSRRRRRKVAEPQEQPRSSPEAEITAQLEGDNDGDYPIAAPDEAEHNVDVDDAWVSEHFPPQLPAAFRSIWETIGFGNDVVKYAVLAHASAHPADTAMGFYSRALRALSVSAQGPASWCLPESDLHSATVSLAVLALLQLYEMKHGTFSGGFTHCRQADKIAAAHLERMRTWEMARRLLHAWVPIKCWFSFQCQPWTSHASPFPSGTENALWDVLLSPAAADIGGGSELLLILLCEARRQGSNALHARFFANDQTGTEYDKLLRNFETLGNGLPTRGEDLRDPLPPGVRESQLEQLRERLDSWHESQPLDDLPMIRTTFKGPNDPDLPYRRPLLFRSNQAALSFIRFASAQSYLSTYLGRPGQQTDEWFTLLIRAVSGLDLDRPLEAIDMPFGLLHLLFQCIVLRGASVQILEWLTDLAPRLEAAGSYALGLVPMWIFKRLTVLVLREKRAGRIVLSIFSDFKATEEIVDTRSPMAARILVLGVDAASQETYQSIIDLSASEDAEDVT
ncbi:hypothetical protein B0T11DRAFT_323474 [Plectosphaerella cucumerina]|uniref:Zn(2)-C6 fungal-type domain-containing protein n=1 Tax=Plectosphaerella cucumerina TaxID=40658 RepID=A0A8K0TND3_9PEZI|nr:hypothetical protein B0T11DRAFT_323474 [Plectosphaerella cucumerina]